ncbi:MAG: hypothetical protein JJ913_09055 [Rhizobiaceae bacterium]|nr:hypothetical protein [Rhizobiaceae bacterium]
MVRSSAFSLALLLAGSASPAALAQELPPLAVYQAMLEANRASGWVLFREYDGRQWIYFTPLQTMHCRLSEIRYSVNSDALDKTFPLVPCVPALPFSLPDDSGPEDIAIVLGSGEAETLTVQVVWSDGAGSEALTYKPCEGVGESACAVMAE